MKGKRKVLYIRDSANLGKGNYFDKLMKMLPDNRAPGVYHNIITHDDQCGIFNGKPCNCDPDIEQISDEEYRRRQQLKKG